MCPQIGSARLAVLHSNWAAATQQLAEAEAVDESFGYTEPPRQLQPIRQCLGWVLLQQGRLAEAEQVGHGSGWTRLGFWV